MTSAELRQLKKATQKLTKWESSGKAFGHFGNIQNKKADKIYEFFCLMKILDDLRPNYDIRLQPGTWNGKIFPEAPAPKKGWPYFVITNKTNKSNGFQVCYGTQLKLSASPLTKFAPDISFQTSSSTLDPDESMVELIMDAKFKYDSDHSISNVQINDFIQRVSAFNTQGAIAINLIFSSLANLKSNCLLTNGKGLSLHRQYCINNTIKQVEKFDAKGSNYNVIG